MAVLMVPPYLQFLDNNGVPLAGGFVYTFSSGTDTPKATYTDDTEVTQAANPIVLDAYGRATIWVNGAYRFKVYDSAMNLIRTTDKVTSFGTLEAATNSYFQSFSGDGSTTIFTTSTDLGTDEKSIQVLVDAGGGKGYDILNPSAYTINGTTLTITSAPAVGTNNIYVFAPFLLSGTVSTAAGQAQAAAVAAAASAATAAGMPTVLAGGTVNAITADYSPDITLVDYRMVAFVSTGANTSTTPTFAPDGLTAHTIVKRGGQALVAGDIGAAGSVHILVYNLANTRWELLNPIFSGDAFGSKLLHVRDEKTANTAGGTFTLGAWRTRTLNTVKTNEISGASLSSNQIILPAGTYFIDAHAPASQVSQHRAKLVNITDTADLILGSSQMADSGTVNDRAVVRGRFTLSGTKTLELQHQGTATATTNGFGVPVNFGIEVYSDVMIWKVA